MLIMLQNPYIAVGVAIGAMFFGYFFGLFEGRGQGYKRRQAEEAEKNEPTAEVEPVPPASPVLPTNEVPLLDVSKDISGQLHLNLDGQRINAEGLNPEQRKRIIAILTLIRPWLESATPPPAPVRPAPVRPDPAPESRRDRPSRPVPAPAKEEEKPAAAPESIVAQIDAILQAQLIGTPLMEKGVRLQESPEGGVIVWVGISSYEGIEDVPDDQIKAAIRTAISAWEQKYTPGV